MDQRRYLVVTVARVIACSGLLSIQRSAVFLRFCTAVNRCLSEKITPLRAGTV